MNDYDLINQKYNKLQSELKKKSTSLVRAGYIPGEDFSHSEPLFLTSGFHYASANHAKKLYAGEKVSGKIYTRVSNPTTEIFEKKLAVSENCEAALATSSGMSAIFLTIISQISSGESIVCAQEIYGGTEQLLLKTLSKFGVKSFFISGKKAENWKIAAEKYKPKIFIFETPSNPTLSICDLEKISEIARDKNIITICDNTVTTPVIQNPKIFGIDLIIHSATKYIDGQGRCIGGAICGDKKIIESIRENEMRNVGNALSPFNSWIFLKGLETLEIRMKKHSENAEKVCQFLEKHPKVNKIHYPFWKKNPQIEIAKKQQKMGGGLLSFEVCDFETGKKLINSVKMISVVGNLGDTKSTIGHPASTSHSQSSSEVLEKSGITPNLIRMSVGIENYEDICLDLEQALN